MMKFLVNPTVWWKHKKTAKKGFQKIRKPVSREYSWWRNWYTRFKKKVCYQIRKLFTQQVKKKRTSFVATDGFKLMKVNSFADEPPLCTEDRKWWVFQKDKLAEDVVGQWRNDWETGGISHVFFLSQRIKNVQLLRKERIVGENNIRLLGDTGIMLKSKN